MWAALTVFSFRTFLTLWVLIAYTRTRDIASAALIDASARHPSSSELIGDAWIPVSTAQRSLHAAQQLRHSTFRRRASHGDCVLVRLTDRSTCAIELSMLNPLTTLVRQWTTCQLAARPTMDQASSRVAAVQRIRIHPDPTRQKSGVRRSQTKDPTHPAGASKY